MKKIEEKNSLTNSLADKEANSNIETMDLSSIEIVKELDKYIIGQQKAKKSVAIALRNRMRRQKIKEDLKEEISPKNIIMIGPTGVGKTEIARRLAKLYQAPFIKVEATKFTEIGYVGRDVESIIRDLVNIAFNIEKRKMEQRIGTQVDGIVEEKLVDLLFPPLNQKTKPASKNMDNPLKMFANLVADVSDKNGDEKEQPKETTIDKEAEERFLKSREKIRKKLLNKDFEEIEVEIEVPANFSRPSGFFDFNNQDGMEQMDGMMKQIIGQFNKGSKRKKVKIKDARKILRESESEQLINLELAQENAVKNTENMGIVFLDEIDKIANKSNGQSSDISREGVQRDLLPLVEGCTVNTKYGPVKTDHVLFIAAGAFHISSPSDIIPELQGRFPIRVELESLSTSDLQKILSQPKNALINQYKALLQTENVSLKFTPDALKSIAQIANDVNQSSVNIGARRLSTILEKLLEDILFDSPNVDKNISIDTEYVHKMLDDIIENEDTSKYIL